MCDDWLTLIKLFNQELLQIAQRRRVLKRAAVRGSTLAQLGARLLLGSGDLFILFGQWLKRRGRPPLVRPTGNGGCCKAAS